MLNGDVFKLHVPSAHNPQKVSAPKRLLGAFKGCSAAQAIDVFHAADEQGAMRSRRRGPAFFTQGVGPEYFESSPSLDNERLSVDVKATDMTVMGPRRQEKARSAGQLPFIDLVARRRLEAGQRVADAGENVEEAFGEDGRTHDGSSIGTVPGNIHARAL